MYALAAVIDGIPEVAAEKAGQLHAVGSASSSAAGQALFLSWGMAARHCRARNTMEPRLRVAQGDPGRQRGERGPHGEPVLTSGGRGRLD